MPFDITIAPAPSSDLMIEEIARSEEEAFLSEKKVRSITDLLEHARSLLSFDVTGEEDVTSLIEDVDQLLAVSIAIAKQQRKRSGN